MNIKKIIKKILAMIADWLQIPGSLYLTERYIYRRGMHIFPSRNIDMLTVGEKTSLHNVMINLWAPVVIEDGVSIAHNVMLITGGHEITSSGAQAKVVPRGGITIRSNAFIGSGSIVLGGLTIGKASIVAAGSVVTRSVPDQQIWGGNPAKFIRKLTNDNVPIESI
jgi:acetyltransferase-like isoleucine patch superfamily enzyme